MSLLSNAVSGLNAANLALQVAGNNTANAAVKGYSRQSVYLNTASGALNGVKVTKVDRIVNNYLNHDIWRSSADLNYYQGFQNYLGFIEQVVGAESLNLNDAVAQITSALNAALAQPDSPAYRQQVLSAADALAQDMAQLNGALDGQRLKLGKELSDLAANSSSLTAQIAELNQRISKAQALNEPVAELQDGRERLVTELAGYLNVSVLEQADGSISISTINGSPLVIGNKAASFSVLDNAVSVSFNQQQYPLTATIGGRLGGLIAVQQQVLEPVTAQFNDFLATMADNVNAALAAGFDLNGAPGKPLFVYEAASALSSLRRNPDITPAELAFRADAAAGVGDNSNIAAIVNAFNSAAPGYNSLIGELAIQSKQVQSSIKTAQILNSNAVSARESISGVNLDEEAANILFYQNMYAANAKVISTADELFRTLINAF